jgi:hypothetical protein
VPRALLRVLNETIVLLHRNVILVPSIQMFQFSQLLSRVTVVCYVLIDLRHILSILLQQLLV